VTTEPSALAGALAALQAELPDITKDKTAKVDTRAGGSYSYSYSDLPAISRAIMPLLSKHGLSFTSRPTLAGERFVLVYELLHAGGESREGAYPLPERGTPQEIGGAITYARRYCLCAVTGVAPDDDDDAAAAEKAAVKREQRTSRRQPANQAQQEPAEPGITGEQQRKMHTLYGVVGLTDRDEKLRYAVEAIGGRKIRSSTELTRAEAGKVIDKLERWAAQSEPPDGQR
jgi:hypothetical protein